METLYGRVKFQKTFGLEESNLFAGFCFPLFSSHTDGMR